MESIPAIDLRHDRVVRLRQGDFNRVTEYPTAPDVLARRYAEAGARRLHVVDLDAAAGEGSNLAWVERLCRQSGLVVQTGGGVRDEASLQRLFDAGAAAVVVGSLAVRQPDRVRGWLSIYGGARIVLALDVRCGPDGRPGVLSNAWRDPAGVTLWDLLELYRGAGLRKVLCTDVSRDGLLAGPNLDLYRECLARFPGLEWQASGGVATAEDLQALAALGLPAVIVGRALLEGRIQAEALQRYRVAT